MWFAVGSSAELACNSSRGADVLAAELPITQIAKARTADFRRLAHAPLLLSLQPALNFPLMVGRPGSFPFVGLVLLELAHRFIDYAIDDASVIGIRMIRILLPLELGAKVEPKPIG
jgi:hypothetical protein